MIEIKKKEGVVGGGGGGISPLTLKGFNKKILLSTRAVT